MKILYFIKIYFENKYFIKFIYFIIILLYTLLLTRISWLINCRSLLGIDDANIYMVYMKNFANGHGFVYNIGGEKVEGFTSLLWTLIGSLFFYISKHPEKLLFIFNVIVCTLTLYNVSNFIDSKADYKFKIFSKESLLFLGIIGIIPGFIDWTILSLMETGLWCFLITSISLKIAKYNSNDYKLKHYLILILISMTLVYTRPESMLLVPFFLFLNLIKEYTLSKAIKTSIVWFLICFLIFSSSLAILIFWRLNYFGYPLPNTYYAKVSSSFVNNLESGLVYIRKLFIEKPFIFLIFILSMWIILKAIILNRSKSNIFLLFLLFSVMLISLIIPLYSGGDHFGLHRVIIPFIPVITLLGILILKEFNFFKDNSKPIFIFFLIFFSNSYNFKDVFLEKLYYPIAHEWWIAINDRNNSKKLNNFFDANKKLPTQGVMCAGGSAFEYKGKTIDLLGLNNTKMAHAIKIKDKNLPKNHASFNIDVFFELSPDLFWYGSDNCKFLSINEPIPNNLKINSYGFAPMVFKNIQNDSLFREQYGYYRIRNIHITDEVLQIFANKKFINSLDTSVYKINNIPYE